MKNKKMKILSLALASVAAGAVFGGATLINQTVEAETVAGKKDLSDVFATTNAELDSLTVGENKITAYNLTDEGSINVKRSLALQWYAPTQANEKLGEKKTFNTTFAFQEWNFKSATLSMDTVSAWATEKDKATNTITFTKESDVYYAQVNDGTKKPFTLNENKITFVLEPTQEDGEWTVKLNGTDCGTFTNIGANYASYVYNEKNPLNFKVDFGTGDEVYVDAQAEDKQLKKAKLVIYDINGQSFENVTEGNQVSDTAAPVVVVNEDISGFLLGTQFALDYVVLDVLQGSSLSKTLECYQYNPNYASDSEDFEKHTTLSTSTYFMDTVYTPEGETEPTTVYKELGSEFVSISFEVWDDLGSKATYYLAWYTTEAVQAGAVVPNTTTKLSDTYSYIYVNTNDKGPEYKLITANEGTQTNDKDANLQTAVDAFQAELEKNAKDVYAGSNAYVEVPSLKWLIEDNNGYRNLRFSVSYRVPGATTASTSSNLSYNAVKIAASKEGYYEFKVFAVDKKGNPMQYYLDKELVDVTADNVWDIDEIPYFTFEVKNQGLKINEPTQKTGTRDSEILDKTYTFSDLTVVGATNLQKAYALYKVDLTKVPGVKESHLTQITYEQIAAKLPDMIPQGKTLASVEDKFDLYLNTYVELLKPIIGFDTTNEALKGMFIPVSEADDRINGKEADAKYEWNANSKSFKTVEEGTFFVIADYWEGDIESQRAAAYKLVVVESKAVTIKGESTWLKENLTSVILFAIAGVLLIIVIILLFIKPSDEKLEDLDKKKNKKEKATEEDKKDEE